MGWKLEGEKSTVRVSLVLLTWHSHMCMQINLSQSILKNTYIKKTKTKELEKSIFTERFCFISGKKRSVSLPEKKFPQQFYFEQKSWWTTHNEGGRRIQFLPTGEKSEGMMGISGCKSRHRTGHGHTGKLPEAPGQSQPLWGLWEGLNYCAQRAPPHPGQVRVHFYSLSSSDRNIRGRAKNRGGGKGRQFAVFVVIIGYIYRKKVN